MIETGLEDLKMIKRLIQLIELLRSNVNDDMVVMIDETIEPWN